MPLGGKDDSSAKRNTTTNRATHRGRAASNERPAIRFSPPVTTGDRDSSPDKRHVSFDRRLERGPTPSNPHRRPNQSPSRSSLANRAAKQSARAERQLQAEMRSSTNGLPPEYHWQDSHGLDADACGELPGAHDRRRLSSGDTRYIRTAQSPSEDSTPLLEITDEEARDQEVCRRVHDLRERIVQFALAFTYETPKRQVRPKGLASRLCMDVENAQLIRYVGCLAYGGPNGVQDWDNLLANSDTLAALVVGIISTALKEHVFSALWFGGTVEQIEELEYLEDRQRESDGYQRTKSRAETCVRFSNEAANHQEEYEAAKLRVEMALVKMLNPLYSLKLAHRTGIPATLRDALFRTVDVAGNISREMRLCGDVIYYWPPTFKDEEFDPTRMECFNLEPMIRASPYSREVNDGIETAVLIGPPEEAEAIVKVVAFPGLVAHRQGGGALAQRLLREERSQKDDPRLPPDVSKAQPMSRDSPFNLDGTEGFRTRVLCKSVVHLTWGRQRLLTREAGTSAHLDAIRDGDFEKYDVDRLGFVELYDFFMRHNAQAPASL